MDAIICHVCHKTWGLHPLGKGLPAGSSQAACGSGADVGGTRKVRYMAGNGAGGDTRSGAGALMEFNGVLDREARPENLNEGFLERKLEELDGLAGGRGAPFWLTLARITELTLLCAGTYADNGELAAAGDLLVNPRLIMIHVRGVPEPLVKERRGGVANQLGDLVPTADGDIEWLKANTWVETRQEPLLPHLYRRLERSGLFSSGYLESVDRRMKRVADVIAILGVWHLFDGRDIGVRLRSLPCGEWEFGGENLCRFGLTVFAALGEELRRLSRDGTENSRSTSESALRGQAVRFRDASRPAPPFAWPGSPEMTVLKR